MTDVADFGLPSNLAGGFGERGRGPSAPRGRRQKRLPRCPALPAWEAPRRPGGLPWGCCGGRRARPCPPATAAARAISSGGGGARKSPARQLVPPRFVPPPPRASRLPRTAKPCADPFADEVAAPAAGEAKPSKAKAKEGEFAVHVRGRGAATVALGGRTAAVLLNTSSCAPALHPWRPRAQTRPLNRRRRLHAPMPQVRMQQRNGRKSLTTVQGLPEAFDYKKILKALKKGECSEAANRCRCASGRPPEQDGVAPRFEMPPQGWGGPGAPPARLLPRITPRHARPPACAPSCAPPPSCACHVSSPPLTPRLISSLYTPNLQSTAATAP